MSRAIGMVETYGLLPAIEGLDAALKSANVSVRSFKYVSGGLVAWFVHGEVGAVRVAVAAGKAAASAVGDVVSDHVIARAVSDVIEILQPPERPGGRKGGTGIHKRDFPAEAKQPKPVEPRQATEPAKAPPVEPTPAKEAAKAPPVEPTPATETAKAPPAEQAQEPISKSTGKSVSKVYTREELETTGTHALRTIARQTEGIKLKRIEIRDARKNALIEEILEAQDKARG